MHDPAHPFLRAELSPSPSQRGKVRDSYCLPNQRRLLITTDRLSAFDRPIGAVLYKGQVLNQLAGWWFHQTADIIPNHLIALPDPNAALVLEAKPWPVEVIVRGYITGVTETALWRRYELGERCIYGHLLPEGLRKNQALRQPIITPTTKGGPQGRDERLSCAEVTEKKLIKPEDWAYIQAAALALFKRGQTIAARAELILVDTKYEFGRTPDGVIRLIDEVHTPDSSRFWEQTSYADRFTSGKEPETLDKEYIRLALQAAGYRGAGDPPSLPASVWQEASHRYVRLYERLTGERFQPGAYPVMPRLFQNLQREGIDVLCL